MRPFLFLFCLIINTVIYCQDSNNKLSLLFIGDVMQHKDQITSAFDVNSGKYHYNTFDHISDLMSEADVTIANLELTLGGQPYTGYPQFSAPDEIAVALKESGVDILVTANNHSADKRRKGIERTIHVLDSLEISHTGTFSSIKEKMETFPMIIEKNSFRIGLLNYTYSTNGITVPEGNIVNLINEEDIIADIKLTISYLVDKIVVFVHWGLEYEQNPSADQINIARLCFDTGADFVIGSHPHVLQRMENTYNRELNKDNVVVYSLGNFVSHQRTTNRDGGAMLRIDLAKNDSSSWVASAGYYLTWVYNPENADGTKGFYVLPASKFQQQSSFLDETAASKMNLFINNSRKLLKSENVNVYEYKYDFDLKTWRFE
ncbi:MAG: CapA family protein [Bacteroidetes bacterium]|nr:CapA family protein [Bacteroidota bacterium]MDA1120718.1 CapA family protein [Bacteroidota bacterium]